MTALTVRAIENRYRLRRATPRRDLPESRLRAGSEDDEIAAAPVATARFRSVAERHRRAAVNGDFLKLAVRKECKPLTIRREERHQGPVRPRQHFRLELIDRAQIESARGAAAGDVRHMAGIGG